MDLSSVIDSFSSTYTVTRRDPSSYGTDGRLVTPRTTTFDISACVQPVTGRDLQRLPEGLRTAEILAIWTPVELKTQGSGQAPDSVAIDGDTYEVRTVERWDTLGAYWMAVAEKVGS